MAEFLCIEMNKERSKKNNFLNGIVDVQELSQIVYVSSCFRLATEKKSVM